VDKMFQGVGLYKLFPITCSLKYRPRRLFT